MKNFQETVGKYNSPLNTLTILRAPAALSVFIFHIIHNTEWIQNTFFTKFFGIGYVGVSLFFILSGFLLTWSFKEGRGYRDFYARRFARVYPLHFIFAFISLALPILAFEPRPLSTLLNLLLLQAWIPDWSYIFSLNAVSWSLSVEMFFYLLAPFIIGWSFRNAEKKNLTVFYLIIFTVLIYAVGSIISAQSTFLDVVVYSNPLTRLGEFISGIVLALFVKNMDENSPIRRLSPRIILIFLIVLISSLFMAVWKISALPLGQTISSYLLTPFFILLIGTCSLYDLNSPGREESRIRNFLVVCGQASFAFYLAHEIIILNMSKYLSEFSGGIGGVSACIAVFILSSGVSYVAFRYIESPCQIKTYRYLMGKNK